MKGGENMNKPTITIAGPIWYPTPDSLPRNKNGEIVVDDYKLIESINNLAKLARLNNMV